MSILNEHLAKVFGSGLTNRIRFSTVFYIKGKCDLNSRRNLIHDCSPNNSLNFAETVITRLFNSLRRIGIKCDAAETINDVLNKLQFSYRSIIITYESELSIDQNQLAGEILFLSFTSSYITKSLFVNTLSFDLSPIPASSSLCAHNFEFLLQESKSKIFCHAANELNKNTIATNAQQNVYRDFYSNEQEQININFGLNYNKGTISHLLATSLKLFYQQHNRLPFIKPDFRFATDNVHIKPFIVKTLVEHDLHLLKAYISNVTENYNASYPIRDVIEELLFRAQKVDIRKLFVVKNIDKLKIFDINDIIDTGHCNYYNYTTSKQLELIKRSLIYSLLESEVVKFISFCQFK